MLERKYPHLVPGGKMKFLSKLAEIFAKGLQIVGVFAPTIEKVLPAEAGVIQTVSKDLNEMAQVILDAEQVGVALQLKGPDKLKAATPGIVDIVLQSSLLANHKIANPTLFNQGCTEIAGGLADVINSLHTDGIEVTNKQA
jgi:hypothetical protein